MLDFISVLKQKQGGPLSAGIDPAKQMVDPPKRIPSQTPPIINTPPQPLPKYERKFDLPDNLPDTSATQPQMTGIIYDPNNISRAKPAGWKAPLAGALGAVAKLAQPREEEFLEPPPNQGVIRRPQPIAYQPIPYQPPILRRY